MKKLTLIAAALLALGACKKAAETANTAADTVKDVAVKTGDIAKDAADATADAVKDAAVAATDTTANIVEGAKDALTATKTRYITAAVEIGCASKSTTDKAALTTKIGEIQKKHGFDMNTWKKAATDFGQEAGMKVAEQLKTACKVN